MALIEPSELENVYLALLRRGFDGDAIHEAIVNVLASGREIRNLSSYVRQAAFHAFLAEKKRRNLSRQDDRAGASAPVQEVLVELAELPLDLVIFVEETSEGRTKGQQSRLNRWRKRRVESSDA